MTTVSMRLPPITRGNVGRALLCGYFAFCALYIGSFQLARDRAVYLAPSALDLYIPEWPASIWIYLSQFVLLPVALLSETDNARRSSAYYAMLASTVASSLVFLIWPTTVGQSMSGDDSLLSIVWHWLYFFDVPGNCFPSLHVALSSIACWMLVRRATIWRTIAPAWWLAIAMSTLTTRQHRLVDVGGGIAVALVALLVTRHVGRGRC